MVYQMPCPVGHMLFVASTMEDESQAETEIAQWAEANGYQVPESSQTYVIYQGGAEAREWRLVERRHVA